MTTPTPLPRPGSGNEPDDLDLRRYAGLFLSNWYWFAMALFAALAIAWFINNYSERIYTVTASMLIKDDEKGSDISAMDNIMPGGNIFRSQQNLQNEMGILRSFSVNYRVMQELPDFHVTTFLIGRRGIAEHRYYRTAPFYLDYGSLDDQTIGLPLTVEIQSDNTFSIEANGSDFSKEEYSFGERINEAGFNFAVVKYESEEFRYNPDNSNKYRIWFNSPDDLANSYRGKLGVEPINDEASLVTLSVSGPNALQEADYLNKLMEVYIRQGLEYKNQTAEKTIQFIDQQLGLIADSLRLAENSLENFRLSNRLIDLSSEGTAIKKRLEDYTSEKIATELQKQYYVYLSEYLESRNESGEIVSPSVMGVSDQMLVGLVDELSGLQVQKKQMNFNFSGNQPAVNLVESKIEDARKALSENVRNNLVNVERTLNDINSRISSVERELNRLPGTERRLINIQRKFDLNNTVYTYMLEKRSEAGIARASNVSGNRVIDEANPYNSSLISPRGRRNYILALMIGLLITGLYIVLVDQLHNRIVDRKDIERGTTVPIIGFIGHNSQGSELPVTEKPGSALAESFRSVRTNMKYYLNGQKSAVISVTSTISGEGKTFISLNLAAILAAAGKKTLLMGVDLRKPRLNKILGKSGVNGLSTYLIGDCEYREIIGATEVENLFFVPAGPVPPNPSELLDTDRMREFMKKASGDFDFVVLDTPPVGIVSDGLLLGAYADLNIFVIRQKYSFKNTLDLIQDIHENKDLKNLTIAVNDIKVSGYYGYGLRYGYGFYEGYGYNYGYGYYGSYGKGDYHKYYTED